MLILKLTHWYRSDEEPGAPEAIYVSADKIVAFDADERYAYEDTATYAAKLGLKRVTRLLLTSDQWPQDVCETPDEIIEMIRQGAQGGALPGGLRVIGHQAPAEGKAG